MHSLKLRRMLGVLAIFTAQGGRFHKTAPKAKTLARIGDGQTPLHTSIVQMPF
ncbi:hypothetical protein [Puniceibacterium sp. IMCC21224]|uniref:hypothetical protein n=1 Tax=Puniceibacterium sp. IMCC21224 TaxID=1618204 RepID=UPI00065DAFFC|nr:hypothetical protein [Puniceibacterium sp. IMCC21224]KMK65872.1 hypothetical protein IMCC21224_11708 [Puniceibacterium sp. IMCC21224]